jgi:hypothetical protein
MFSSKSLWVIPFQAHFQQFSIIFVFSFYLFAFAFVYELKLLTKNTLLCGWYILFVLWFEKIVGKKRKDKKKRDVQE